MISVSIDPEEDTPPRLREYAKKFSAGPQWQHYTGTVAASVAMQKAFNAYRGDKMNHDPLTLMRAAPGKPWVRVDGFASAADLQGQYQAMTAAAN
jgi:protein SCO1/2